MEKRTDAGVTTVSGVEDVPTHSPGSLIPVTVSRDEMPEDMTSPEAIDAHSPSHRQASQLIMAAALVMFMLSLGVTAYVGVVVSQPGNNSAAPIIVVSENDAEKEPIALTYGERVSFSEPNFFAEIKEAMILGHSTFIEVDLRAMQLRLYKEGDIIFATEIVSKGEKGSLTETPAGLYVIEKKDEAYLSPESGAIHPWSMLFQGNFYIHGQPYFETPTDELVPHVGGGVRLLDEAAQQLFDMVPLETTVLVHEETAQPDSFVYEPRVPEVSADHYLVADIDNNAVLAGNDMDAVVPIASVTKLMTALVAIEHLNVEDQITLAGGASASTTIPRLQSGQSVSVYDLLRLMLVESSNEAANVLADQLGRRDFVDLMNDKAVSLGLSDTSFVDPSGIGAGNVSTLRDLLHLTQYIYRNRSFVLKLTAESDLLHIVSGTKFPDLNNFNDITGVDSFLGGKVGETRAAGQTSISLHEIIVKDEQRVIAVIVLNSSDRPGDVRILTQYISDRFSL